MAVVEVYIARCNKGSGAGQQFGKMAEAFLWAMETAKRGSACAVYKVSGCPVFNLWEDPQLIATFGDMSKPDEEHQVAQVA